MRLAFKDAPYAVEAVQWDGDFVVCGIDISPEFIKQALKNGSMFFNTGDLYISGERFGNYGSLEKDFKVEVGSWVVFSDGLFYVLSTEQIYKYFKKFDESCDQLFQAKEKVQNRFTSRCDVDGIVKIKMDIDDD